MAILPFHFHNRDRERRSLTASLHSPKSELIILYGRRGVGKSALLRAVLNAQGTPFLYYRAVRRTLPLQLAALTDAFRAAFPLVFLPQPFASTSLRGTGVRGRRTGKSGRDHTGLCGDR